MSWALGVVAALYGLMGARSYWRRDLHDQGYPAPDVADRELDDLAQQYPAHARIEYSGERYILVRAASLSTEFFELVTNTLGSRYTYTCNRCLVKCPQFRNGASAETVEADGPPLQ